jgi:hypothetical protein
MTYSESLIEAKVRYSCIEHWTAILRHTKHFHTGSLWGLNWFWRDDTRVHVIPAPWFPRCYGGLQDQ